MHSDQAIACAKQGVDAIGLIFYPKSPRFLSDAMGRAVSRAVSPRVKTIGVFVNESFSNIMARVHHCQLSGVQLHGQESPELVTRLRNEDLFVIKALVVDGIPDLSTANRYNASAYLVECSKGKLPGGNALPWNWSEAGGLGKSFPFILAGGLSAENITDAIKSCSPDAVDISSGVELSPGKKDINKVKTFVDTVLNYTGKKKLIKIF